MRLFISAPLPKNTKRELAKAREEFLEFPAKWVKEENFHITLIFIGETKESEAKKVAEAIDVATKDLNLINLETDGLSLLPNEKRPRILAIKLTGETEKLPKLVGNIEKGLREREILRHVQDKPFRPHVTLARLKKLRSGEKKELREKIRFYNLPTIEFKARRVELTESKLTPTGPVYKALKRYTLP